MKNTIIIIVSLILMSGCTSSTQKIADKSLSEGITQEHLIVNNLAKIAKQSIVDKGVANARVAATESDADAAQSAVQDAVSEFDKVNYLLIQHERARSLMRVGQQYVWSQKGIFDIIIDEFKKAKENSDAKDADAL